MCNRSDDDRLKGKSGPMPQTSTDTNQGRLAAGSVSIDPDEIEKFSAIADEWWDARGKFRPLHKFNPVRLGYIRDRLCDHFGLDRRAKKPLAGLRLLDIGCGGGLLCEPMVRLGADVVGVDAAERNVKTAATHARSMGLEIDYRCSTAEELAAAGESFDVVLNMEVVEHVANAQAFLADCAGMVRPGGVMIVATLNRTPKAYALAIVGAEYLLRWLPRGTHDWNKFVTPREVESALTGAGLTIGEVRGVSYNPLLDSWRTSRDTGVNYIVLATR